MQDFEDYWNLLVNSLNEIISKIPDNIYTLVQPHKLVAIGLVVENRRSDLIKFRSINGHKIGNIKYKISKELDAKLNA